MILKSMTEFVFMLRNRTTSELCKDFPRAFTLPVYNGNQDDMVKAMLEIDAIQWKLTGEYAKFLIKKLELWMFVPCDKKGNVYVDYKTYQPKKGTICIPYEGLFEVSRKGKDVELLNGLQFWKDDQRYYNKKKYEETLKEYEEAKDRVLFEGFTYHIGLDKNNPYFWYIKNSSCKVHDYEFEVSKISVEIIANRNYQIILTPTAQKIIGL